MTATILRLTAKLFNLLAVIAYTVLNTAREVWLASESAAARKFNEYKHQRRWDIEAKHELELGRADELDEMALQLEAQAGAVRSDTYRTRDNQLADLAKETL